MASEEYIFNDAIQVDKELTIAARGLTPNHIHFPTQIRAREFVGRLVSFEHGQDATRIVLLGGDGGTYGVTMPHLELIKVQHS